MPKSTSWFDRRRVRTTPNEYVLPQELVDGFSPTVGTDEDDPFLVFIVPETSGSGLFGIFVEPITDGGYAITIPITRLGVLFTLQRLLSQSVRSDQISVTDELQQARTALRYCDLYNDVLRQESAISEFSRVQQVNELFRTAEPDHVLLEGDWSEMSLQSIVEALDDAAVRHFGPLDAFIWAAMPPFDRWLGLAFVCRAVSRLPPSGMVEPAGRWFSYSLNFSLYHEFAHAAYGHLHMLGKLPNVEGTSMKPLAVARTELHADQVAISLMYDRGMKRHIAEGRSEDGICDFRRMLWGILVNFNLLHVNQVMDAKAERMTLRASNEFSMWPSATVRLAMIVRQLESLMPPEVDVRSEVRSYIRSICAAADMLQWPRFAALAAAAAEAISLSDDAELIWCLDFLSLLESQTRDEAAWMRIAQRCGAILASPNRRGF